MDRRLLGLLHLHRDHRGARGPGDSAQERAQDRTDHGAAPFRNEELRTPVAVTAARAGPAVVVVHPENGPDVASQAEGQPHEAAEEDGGPNPHPRDHDGPEDIRGDAADHADETGDEALFLPEAERAHPQLVAGDRAHAVARE